MDAYQQLSCGTCVKAVQTLEASLVTTQRIMIVMPSQAAMLTYNYISLLDTVIEKEARFKDIAQSPGGLEELDYSENI